VSRNVLTESRRAAVFNRSRVGTTVQLTRRPAGPQPRWPRWRHPVWTSPGTDFSGRRGADGAPW